MLRTLKHSARVAADAIADQLDPHKAVYNRYQSFTMIPQRTFTENLRLCHDLAPPEGCIVECGVWRGGMSAGMADVLPGRTHYLLDSFEGLPKAKEIDGPAALAWQADTQSPNYFDNCAAEQSFAERAMAMSSAGRVHIVKGWFDQTLASFVPAEPIGVLRLDCDWYESMIVCLRALMPHVREGGLILVDDYLVWDGCSHAMHQYLAETQSRDRIRTSPHGVCYLRHAT